MLEAAGVTFTVVAPNVDEDLMKDMLMGGGAPGPRIADALAEAKALAGSACAPQGRELHELRAMLEEKGVCV